MSHERPFFETVLVKQQMKLQNLYNFLLIGSSLLVWVFMTAAKHAEYDTNYVFFASAVLISLLATLFPF